MSYYISLLVSIYLLNELLRLLSAPFMLSLCNISYALFWLLSVFCGLFYGFRGFLTRCNALQRTIIYWVDVLYIFFYGAIFSMPVNVYQSVYALMLLYHICLRKLPKGLFYLYFRGVYNSIY